MMVMREDTQHGIYTLVVIPVSASFFRSAGRNTRMHTSLSAVSMAAEYSTSALPDTLNFIQAEVSNMTW